MCVWRTMDSMQGRRSPLLLAAANGEEVQRAVVGGAQREVGRGDSRDEPVVERLGDAQPRVHAVPREALDRALVDRELAGVVEAQDLDVGVVRLAQLAELL